MADPVLLYRTKSELRLAELEALKRPLTKAESEDLRRCLHAIYIRNWRILKGVTGSGGDLVDVQRKAREEINEIALRMEAATDPEWPIPVTTPKAVSWQEKARHGSKALCRAIQAAQVAP